jgi:hypothetical protein
LKGTHQMSNTMNDQRPHTTTCHREIVEFLW